MISDTSIWSRKPCNPSTTRSARGCHPCLRYVLLPMSPGRTNIMSGGESVSQSPLKEKAFSTFLDQNPPFELRTKTGVSPPIFSRNPSWLVQILANPSISIGAGSNADIAAFISDVEQAGRTAARDDVHLVERAVRYAALSSSARSTTGQLPPTIIVAAARHGLGMKRRADCSRYLRAESPFDARARKDIGARRGYGHQPGSAQICRFKSRTGFEPVTFRL